MLSLLPTKKVRKHSCIQLKLGHNQEKLGHRQEKLGHHNLQMTQGKEKFGKKNC